MPGRQSASYEDLSSVFTAKSVAVVGASDRPGSWGHRLVTRLMGSGYAGEIYPINPRLESALGLRAFASVSDLPNGADLALLMIRPESIPDAVKECAEANIKSVIALTTGFAETGPSGDVLEDRIAEIVDASGMRFIGPNCLGVLDSARGLNFYFPELPKRGTTAIVAGGGGIGLYMCEAASELGIGLSKFIALGNQLRTDLIDCLDWLRDDEETQAVAVYVEGAPRTASPGFMRRLVSSLAALAEVKGVSVFQGGQTALSARLAYSHTAAIATPRALFGGACRQYGICVASTPSDAVVMADALGRRRVDGGERVAVESSGSQGMYIADLCTRAGLEVSELHESDHARLAAVLPHLTEVHNPVDMAGIERMRGLLVEALEVLSASPDYDALIYAVPNADQVAHLSESELRSLAAGLGALATQSRKPIVGIEWLGRTDPLIRTSLQKSGQIVTALPEEGVRILESLARCGSRAAVT